MQWSDSPKSPETRVFPRGKTLGITQSINDIGAEEIAVACVLAGHICPPRKTRGE